MDEAHEGFVMKNRRAFCPNGEGGGVTNDCSSESDGFESLFRQGKNGPVPVGAAHGNPVPGARKVKSVEFSDAARIEEIASDAGVKDLATLLKICAADGDGAEVWVDHGEVSFGGDRYVKVSASTPVDPDDPSSGAGSTDVRIEVVDGKPMVHYVYFQRNNKSQAAIDVEKGDSGYSATEAAYGEAIFEKMLLSMEAAEKSGIHEAYTEASGSPGERLFRGYALWGRFGFDAELPDGYGDMILSHQESTGAKVLTPEIEEKVARTGIVTLQELLATKTGERWWRDNGATIDMMMNVKDKERMGYQRYRKMLSMVKKAKSRGSRSYRDFIRFASRSLVSDDLSRWHGFVPEDIKAFFYEAAGRMRMHR